MALFGFYYKIFLGSVLWKMLFTNLYSLYTQKNRKLEADYSQLVTVLSLKSCPYNLNYFYKKKIGYSVVIKLIFNHVMSINVRKFLKEDSWMRLRNYALTSVNVKYGI